MSKDFTQENRLMRVHVAEDRRRDAKKLRRNLWAKAMVGKRVPITTYEDDGTPVVEEIELETETEALEAFDHQLRVEQQIRFDKKNLNHLRENTVAVLVPVGIRTMKQRDDNGDVIRDDSGNPVYSRQYLYEQRILNDKGEFVND